MTTQPFLSIKDVAEHLGVEYKTVYRLIRRGELAAAKIGGVYRLRQSDVDAYIEQQLAATRQKALLAQTNRGPASTRCSLCFRYIPDDQMAAGICHIEYCQAAICSACWTQQPSFCHQHQPTLADKLQTAQVAQQAGDLPLVLTAIEARRRELNFCNRFERKVQAFAHIFLPSREQPLPLTNILYDHTIHDEDHFVPAVEGLSSQHPGHLPTNRRSRYAFWDKQGNQLLTIEASTHSRLINYVRDGFDTAPLSQAELMNWLLGYVTEAEQSQSPWIVGLAAPTGWTDEALAIITGTERGDAWAHGLVYPCLIDLERKTIHSAANNRFVQHYLRLFTLLLPEEESALVEQYINQAVRYEGSLSASDIQQATAVDPGAVLATFERLAATGEYFIEDVDGIGRVIARL